MRPGGQSRPRLLRRQGDGVPGVRDWPSWPVAGSRGAGVASRQMECGERFGSVEAVGTRWRGVCGQSGGRAGDVQEVMPPQPELVSLGASRRLRLFLCVPLPSRPICLNCVSRPRDGWGGSDAKPAIKMGLEWVLM
jgi:hypothetical protein